MKHITIIVCVPVAMPSRHVPGSIQRQCSECRCGVWVAPSTIRDMPDQQGELQILCIACASAEILEAKRTGSPIDRVPITENQKLDLAAMRKP